MINNVAFYKGIVMISHRLISRCKKLSTLLYCFFYFKPNIFYKTVQVIVFSFICLVLHIYYFLTYKMRYSLTAAG